jgi:GT2 family glycosyltransferase
MISIVICSNRDDRFAAVAKNLDGLLAAQPHEIIRISDARSMAEGYTRGIAASRGEFFIFCHDDIEILSPDFAARLAAHLEQFDLVGVAGTDCLFRGKWVAAGRPHIFGQLAQVHPRGGWVVCNFGVHGRAAGGIQAMDGMFLAARRSVVEKIPFDARTFDAFHLYDLDFTFAAHLAGLRLGVANDLHVIHESLGKFDQTWRKYADRFEQKYAGRLSRFTPPAHLSFPQVHVHTREQALEVMEANLTAP